MALNSQFARVYGDADTRVFLAPKGSTLPTDLTGDPDAAFIDVGWLADDGIQLNTDKDVKDFTGLQGGGLIRRKVGKVIKKFTFLCAEDNYVVRKIMNSGNDYTKFGTGTAAYGKTSIIDNQNTTVEMAAVIHLVDGDNIDRYVCSALDLTYMGEAQLAKNDELRVAKIEGTIIAGSIADNLTNSAGVMAGLV